MELKQLDATTHEVMRDFLQVLALTCDDHVHSFYPHVLFKYSHPH